MPRLRRSLLFVPGDDERKLDKSHQSAADVLLFDLEDAVVAARKDRARAAVAARLRAATSDGPELAVRVNPPGTPAHEDDVDAVVAAGATALVVPKVVGGDVLHALAARLDGLDRDGRVALLALIESPAGLLAAGDWSSWPRRVEAVCYGHADFSLAMGLDGADAGEGIAWHARCEVALAARAADRAPIDTVHLDVRDADGCRRDARRGRELGYDGKLCLHPQQVEIVNEVYTPTAAAVARAREVVEAWAEAERAGRGVVTVGGTMSDAPLVALQQRVLERAARAAAPRRMT